MCLLPNYSFEVTCATPFRKFQTWAQVLGFRHGLHRLSSWLTTPHTPVLCCVHTIVCSTFLPLLVSAGFEIREISGVPNHRVVSSIVLAITFWPSGLSHLDPFFFEPIACQVGTMFPVRLVQCTELEVSFLLAWCIQWVVIPSASQSFSSNNSDTLHTYDPLFTSHITMMYLSSLMNHIRFLLFPPNTLYTSTAPSLYCYVQIEGFYYYFHYYDYYSPTYKGNILYLLSIFGLFNLRWGLLVPSILL